MRNVERRNQRGMSLAELMIVVAILAIIVAGAVGGCAAIMSGDDVKKDAEKNARQTATELGIKVDGVSCGDRANSKGQVYCSVNSGGKIIPFSCIGKYKFGNGCKMQTVVAPGVEQ